MTVPGGGHEHAGTEPALRRALEVAAAEVRVEPQTFSQASAGWRRRYRRRRVVLSALAATVFAVADLVGLWALNNADEQTHVIFSDPDRPGASEPAPRLVWP